VCVCVCFSFSFLEFEKRNKKKLTSKHNHDFNDPEGARDDGGGGEKGLRASYEPFVNNSQRIEKEKTKRISEEKEEFKKKKRRK